MSDANDKILLTRIVAALVPVPGVRAVALGGSRARGTAVADSDYDIGLYYDPQEPIDVTELGRVAATLDDRGAAAEVTAIGGWGPWIDGGGWLVIGGVHVDLLYRSLDRVNDAIDDAHAGKVERFYQPGHPHAFLPAITSVRSLRRGSCTIPTAFLQACSGAAGPIRPRWRAHCVPASNGKPTLRWRARACDLLAELVAESRRLQA